MNTKNIEQILIGLIERVDHLEKVVQMRTKSFRPPTVEEVKEYCLKRKNSVNPTDFVNHYNANGWMRGKTKIKCWKSCVHTWEKNSIKTNGDQSWI